MEHIQDEILKQHFDVGVDGRYHCRYCSYDSQLPNKATSHWAKRHKGQDLLAMAEPYLEPGQEPDDWVLEQEPDDDDANNLKDQEV